MIGSTRRWLMIGLGLIGIMTIVAASLRLPTLIFGRTRLRFRYKSGELSQPAYRALAERPGWSAAQATVGPALRLFGLVRRPSSDTAPWLLFYPGNSAQQLSSGQAFLTRVAGDQDWGLAVFAYRSFDSSGGVAHVADMGEDAPAILAQLCDTVSVVPSRVHLLGFSIGGYFATRAAGVSARLGKPVATLSLLASVNDIVMVRRSFWDKLDIGDDYQTTPFLAAVPAPVLVLQGTDDEALWGPGQGRSIAHELGNRAKYVELASVGHEAILFDTKAIEEVRALIISHQK